MDEHPPPPDDEEPTEHDLKQDEFMAALMEELAEERRLRAQMAQLLQAQKIYMTDDMKDEDDEPDGPPEPKQDPPIWGHDGYRIFPVNGTWMSLRGDDVFCDAIREEFRDRYSLKRDIFWEQRSRNKEGKWEIKVVPSG